MQVSLGVFTQTKTMPYYLDQSALIDNAGRVFATCEKSYPVFPGEAYVTPAGPRTMPVIETPYGRIATAICDNFHFPTLIGQAVRNDVDIGMAPYNDVTPFGQQDSVVAIFRAIENGYSIVKATGNGVSMIVDYQGRVPGQQNYGDGGGVMLASVPTHGVVMIYSRIGDSFA